MYSVSKAQMVAGTRGEGESCAGVIAGLAVCASDDTVRIGDRKVFSLDPFAGHEKPFEVVVRVGEEFDLPMIGAKAARVWATEGSEFEVEHLVADGAWAKKSTGADGRIRFTCLGRVVDARVTRSAGRSGLMEIRGRVGAAMEIRHPIDGLSVSSQGEISMVVRMDGELHAIALAPVGAGSSYEQIADVAFEDQGFSSINWTSYDAHSGRFRLSTAEGLYEASVGANSVAVERLSSPKHLDVDINGTLSRVLLLTQ
jgi:hypothetical protein